MATQLNREQAVTNLQKYLRRLSFETSDRTRPPVDGIFDTATRDSLVQFQRSMGIPDTGVADKKTWDALFDEYRRVTRDEREMEGLYLFPENPSDYAVSLGDTLTLVRIIQLLLSELRATYDIFEDITESGTYDSKTQNAITQFQRINGIPPTGTVDLRTWNRLVREYSNLSLREQT